MSDVVLDAAPAHGEEPPPARRVGLAGKAAFYTGSCGLLTAMAADSIAVLGRHIGFTFLGAIEIVQASIVLIASAAMVSVTLARGHAAVHILTDRLGTFWRTRLARAANLLSVLALLLLAIGSIMVLGDLWNGHERSELLHIPLRWLRTLMVLALLLVGGTFLTQAFARRSDES